MVDEKNNREITFSSGDIPVLKVEGKTLPEVWEKSLIEVWNKGIAIKTQYDRPNDPPSRDASMVMIIHEPFSEPRIHRALPTGLDELEIYRQEVVIGIHDHWIKSHGWSYSYHDRLFNYEVKDKKIDQIAAAVENLIECPYTRRAQAITWDPELDAKHDEPPCLQRIWIRILEDPEKGPVLNMNTHWRSRDAYKAAFMNIFALTDLQRVLAEEVSDKMGREIKVGRYADMVDSYHIYGSYFDQFRGFLETLEKKTFEDRTFTTAFAEQFFKEARIRIARE